MSTRGKTVRRSSAGPPAAAAAAAAQAPPSAAQASTESALADLLQQEHRLSTRQPWTRLDRGLRVQRLRAFAAAQAEATTPAEVAALARALVEALDAKALSSKARVTYDAEAGVVCDIKGLRLSRGSSGRLEARLEPLGRPTKKRSGGGLEGGGAAAASSAADK